MIRLKSLILEVNRQQVYNMLRKPEILQQIFSEFNESPAEWLGGGYYGSAIATKSGKVIKFTDDSYEVALAARISKRARRPHLINIYDVRPLTNINLGDDRWGDPIQAHGFYAIHMDKVIPLENMNYYAAEMWDYINYRYFQEDKTDQEIYELMKSRSHQYSNSATELVSKIIAQRQKVLRDARAMNVRTFEAHRGNVGFTPEGNFVLYDLQSEKNPIETKYTDYSIPSPSKSTIGKTIDVAKFTTDGIDTPNDPTM